MILENKNINSFLETIFSEKKFEQFDVDLDFLKFYLFINICIELHWTFQCISIQILFFKQNFRKFQDRQHQIALTFVSEKNNKKTFNIFYSRGS